MAVAPLSPWERKTFHANLPPLSPWEKQVFGEAASSGSGRGGSPPSAAAPPSPSGPVRPPSYSGEITIPGQDPDWKSLIQGDYNVIAGGSDLDLYSGQLDQARRDAIRRAIVNTGIVPGSALNDVDQATIEAANANNFSGRAELDRTKGRRSTDLAARLGDRGILGSGALAGGQSRLQEEYERGSSGLLNQLLETISGAESMTAEKKNEIARQRAALRAEAASRLAQDPRYQGGGSSKAVRDAGSGLYYTPDGRWYDAGGNRVDAPVATSPVAAPPTSQLGGQRFGHQDF